MRSKAVCTVIGVVVGGLLGSSLGIAGFGGAIAGTVPLAILGGYIGWRFCSWLESKRGKD